MCRFKLIKWWSQSFLVGIERIICGFRDDDGVVQHLQNFNTKDLPKMANVIFVFSVRICNIQAAISNNTRALFGLNSNFLPIFFTLSRRSIN